jgi:hypothetical protein
MKKLIIKLNNLFYLTLFYFFHNQNTIKNLCVLAYLSPNPDLQDTYFLTVLVGDCTQYSFTSEYLEELSKYVVKMEEMDWSILAEDSTLDYKIVEAKKWKDTYFFQIVGEGKWENWIEEVKESKKGKE